MAPLLFTPIGVLGQVARVRQLATSRVRGLAQQQMKSGTFGPDPVYVLRLNLTLGALAAQ